MKRTLVCSLAALALTAAACGSDDTGSASPATASEPAAQSAATAGTTATTPTSAAATDAPATTAAGAADPYATSAGTESLALSNTSLGDVLTVGGFTVYLFVPDAQGDPTCYDQCEQNWPVVGELSGVGDGLDASLLGTVTRTDGSVQATYNGWPLYYFASDAAPGDVKGQGLGDNWYVIDASGDGIS